MRSYTYLRPLVACEFNRTSRNGWLPQVRELSTEKARVYFRNGVWYAEHSTAAYPGVGATPEHAFENMLMNCPQKTRFDFLAVAAI